MKGDNYTARKPVISIHSFNDIEFPDDFISSHRYRVQEHATISALLGLILMLLSFFSGLFQ